MYQYLRGKIFIPYVAFRQAHREVFEYLIEDFKTYKPLLSGIKNEYEMMLAYQRQVIRELEPLKVSTDFLICKFRKVMNSTYTCRY